MSTEARITVVRVAHQGASGEDVFMAFCDEIPAPASPYHAEPLRHVIFAATREGALEGMRTYLRNLGLSAPEDTPTDKD